MVVSQRQLLAALIHQVEDELLILPVLPCENILPLKHGCIQTTPSEGGEHILDDPLDMFSAVHFSRSIVSGALCKR